MKKVIDIEEDLALAILSRVRDRFEEIGDPPYKVNDDSGDEKPIEKGDVDIQCICCLLPIEKGDIFISMPCCGSYSHVSCIGKVANSHRYQMSHSCPQCLASFSESFEELVIKLWETIRRQESN